MSSVVHIFTLHQYYGQKFRRESKDCALSSEHDVRLQPWAKVELTSHRLTGTKLFQGPLTNIRLHFKTHQKDIHFSPFLGTIICGISGASQGLCP